MRLAANDLLRAGYWRLRSHPPDAAHMLGMLAHAARTAAGLRRARAGRRAVAILLLERMGDAVSAEPIARLARRRFPDAWICWITKPQHMEMPATYPEVDQVIGAGCFTEAVLLARLCRFDAVWNLHYNGYECPHCRIPRNDPDVDLTLENHYSGRSLLAVSCRCGGLPPLDESPRLTPPPAAVAAVDALALPPRLLAIHCTSVDPQRDWTDAKWRELVVRLLEADPAMTVAEVGLRPVVATGEAPRLRSLCGRLSVLQTAEAIRRAGLFVGIDSGPAHLAHAVGTPGVILLGHFRNFPHHVPYAGRYGNGEAATLLHADGDAAILTVDEVFAAVMARWSAPGDAAQRLFDAVGGGVQ